MSAQPSLLETAPTLGRVSTSCDGWLIDAEPHVMVRVRTLFKSGSSAGKGERTHNRLIVPRTRDVAKDIDWLTQRYPLTIELLAQIDIQRMARAYDDALRAAARGDKDQSLNFGRDALAMAEPARPHQAGFRNLFKDVRRMLLGDTIGLGKTISAITTLCEPESRPALIVVPTHLTIQWHHQLRRFLPGASTHIIKGRKLYELPKVDVYITAYTRLQGWQDHFDALGLKTIVFDEVQDLRHVGTEKRIVARAVSEKAEYVMGLSGTPIYNYGVEIWSVIDVISPGALGPLTQFHNEWCSGDKMVKDTVALHSFLKTQGLFLRRTKKDLGIEPEPVTKEVVTLEGDLEELAKVQDIARTLAISVLSNRVGESENSARQLDWRLRQATGVAKAKAVAEFVKMLVESGEKVFLVGWHREVYTTWLKALQAFSPVMYTGTESPLQKADAVKRFVSGQAKVFICSLRSGAGLDGLQHACSNVVFGELDWSPHVMDQVVGRLDREGQTKPVNAYFLVIEDGADPFMMSVLGDKRSQHDGVIEGKEGEVEVLADTGMRTDRIRGMAEAYLASIGEAPPAPAPTNGLHADVVAALSQLRLPSNSEKEMQEAIGSVLPAMLLGATVEREFRIGERGRLDFRISRGAEVVAVECKIDQTGRAAVYRQVRRYAEEAGITAAVILAPWAGVSNFVVEGVPVTVVDYSKRRVTA